MYPQDPKQRLLPLPQINPTSPSNTYSMARRGFNVTPGQTLRDNSYMNLNEDALRQLCHSMEINELDKFVRTSTENLRLCYDILNDKIYEERLNLKRRVKERILEELEELEPGTKLDVSNVFDINIDTSPRVGKVVRVQDFGTVAVPGFRWLVVKRNKLQELVDILSVE